MFKMTVYAAITDNGDGGFTAHCYSSTAERTKNHPGIDEENDPYEYGYLCAPEDIEVNDDGSFKKFSLHGGQ